MKEIHSTNYKEVLQYCNDIKTGKILSGVFTKKAINRFLDDIKKSKESGYPFYLDIDKADLVIDFAESLKIPDMPTADKKLKLLSWHKFIYYNLFGWCYKDNPNRRRFRQAYIEVARKNSKTTSLLFPIILYDFLTSEKAESYLVSKDGDQAEKSFKELVEIIKADPALDSACKETVSTITTAGSRISFFSSDSGGIDNDYVKQAFTTHTKMLCNLQLLAAADLPELEQLYLTLQQLREIETILLKTDPVKEIDNYERYTKMVIKLGNRFTTLAAKYYISPAARLRLTSDCLNIEKNKRDLENQSITAKLLAAKKV